MGIGRRGAEAYSSSSEEDEIQPAAPPRSEVLKAQSLTRLHAENAAANLNAQAMYERRRHKSFFLVPLSFSVFQGGGGART